MKIAIMQPYFFPYIGYFQLINSVDTFVIYDDVNYIKGGWINRNYIISNNGKSIFTLPLISSSSNKKINEIEISKNHKLIKTIEYNYKRAPYFQEIQPVISDILNSESYNLAKFLENQIKIICKRLEIETKILVSSSLNKNNLLKGEEKVIDICKSLNATSYINSPGGKQLYSENKFFSEGIELRFIEPCIVPYTQYGSNFEKNLSVIDVLMFNHKNRLLDIVHQYEIK